MRERSAKLMTGMVERLSKNPGFMANTFSLYQQQERLDDEALARELRTTQAMILRLSLCKRPQTTAQTFDEQVQQLAEFTSIEISGLVHIIRQVEARSSESLGVKVRPTEIAIAFLQLVIRGFRVAVFHQVTPILTGALIVALICAGVFWWKGETYQSPGPSQIPLQKSEPDEPTDKTKENTIVGGGLVKSETEQSLNAGQAITEKATKVKMRAIKRIERTAGVIATLTIDLGDYNTMRDRLRGKEQKSKEPTKIIKLPQSRTRISFRLPEGSSKGAYSISIIDAFNNPLISIKARSTNGLTLTVILDASSLEAKTYRLCVSHADEAPSFYSVEVEKQQKS